MIVLNNKEKLGRTFGVIYAFFGEYLGKIF